MVKLVIIADDLTGALDTGVQFSKKNISTAVVADINLNFEKEFTDIDVVVVDTESRHIPQEEAKERVKKVISKFDRKKVKFFYKKVDSTLRGNLGSEIEGFMEELDINEAVFVPAFPFGKRIVKDGVLYVDGKKLAETSFGNDILNPVKHSFIPDIIREQTDIETAVIKIEGSILKTDKKRKIYLFDGETMADMVKIGEKLNESNLLNYTIGNAGFAEILASYIESDSMKPDISIEDERIFFICGSVNVISLKQCSYAEKIGYNCKNLKFDEITTDLYKYSESYMTDKKEIEDQLDRDKRVLLKTSEFDDVITRAVNYSKEKNISIEKITHNVAANTGVLVSEIVKDKRIQNLIVFGGDTLIGILKHLEYRYIVPLAEILPGIVFTKVIMNEGINLNIITKAGGFGEEDIVEKIDKFIKMRI